MKLLTFELNEKEYGLPLEKAKEVIRLHKITPVPEAAAFIEGVMSLRGRIIPVINLRVKLGIPKMGSDRGSRIIIVNTENNIMGVLVDGVKEVITLADEKIEPPDEVLKDAVYLTGMTKTDKGLLLLVDMDLLLSSEDRSGIESVKSRIEPVRKQ